MNISDISCLYENPKNLSSDSVQFANQKLKDANSNTASSTLLPGILSSDIAFEESIKDKLSYLAGIKRMLVFDDMPIDNFDELIAYAKKAGFNVEVQPL